MVTDTKWLTVWSQWENAMAGHQRQECILGRAIRDDLPEERILESGLERWGRV